MKKQFIRLTLFILLVSNGVSAQNDTTANKSFGKWLTSTPWLVSIDVSMVDDNNDVGSIFRGLRKYQYYPAKFTIEKKIVKGWSAQLTFASTSIKPHNYLALDANAKYSFLHKKTSKFDPFAILGLGYTYRDYSIEVPNDFEGSSLNSLTFQTGLGANYWLFQNVGITAQGLAKFTNDNYLQASLGIVFKIGNNKAPECTVAPKSQEAQEALQHLRGIINKQ